jgi:hypothetical protein
MNVWPCQKALSYAKLAVFHRTLAVVDQPQFVVSKVLEEMQNFVATPAEESILMLALTNKMKEAGLPEHEQNPGIKGTGASRVGGQL